MLILSFDVGIKNLAYSIIKYNEDDTTIEILEWNIINLLKDVFDNQKMMNFIFVKNIKKILI